MCEMSTRQKRFYQAVKNKILFEDLLQSANTSTENKSTSLLMNLVMQFRKVFLPLILLVTASKNDNSITRIEQFLVNFKYKLYTFSKLIVNSTAFFQA